MKQLAVSLSLAPRSVTVASRLRRALAIGLPLIVVLAVARPAHAAADATYDLVFRAYCRQDTAAFCGWGTEVAFRDHLQRQVALVNETFRPAGISFRFKDLIVDHESTYSAITADNGDIDVPGTVEGDLVRELHELAAQTPDVITVFLLPRPTVCWSGVPPDNTPIYPEVFHGLFCTPAATGAVLAHELGHHHCLPHPFTFDDDADVPGHFANHDGDGLADTPPDPGIFEGYSATNPGADENQLGQRLFEHTWCEVDATQAADPGSPRPNTCELACYYRMDDHTSLIAADPEPHLSMSYYGQCRGPVVSGGHRIEGFTPDSVERIRTCALDTPARAANVNVCADRGNDTDHDGWCDMDDLCPYRANTSNAPDDLDGDGVPNVCDNCVGISNPDQADLDRDSLGDACDGDRDGDGCDNSTDLHPDAAWIEAGVTLHIGCDSEREVSWQFEGDDNDLDGITDCEDDDDDGDGVLDDDDPCPTSPGTDELNCTRIDEICQPLYKAACAGFCGKDFFVELVSNVDPDHRIVFPGVSLVHDRVRLVPPRSFTATQASRALAGDAFGVSGSDVRLSLVLRNRTQRIAPVTIATFSPSQMLYDTAAPGRVVELSFGIDGMLSSRPVWSLTIGADDSPADADGDGVPDAVDDCLMADDPAQRDHDSDGFGDACDPDLDNSGIVDAGDLARIHACVGVDPRREFVLAEPGLPRPLAEVVTSDEAARSLACAPADLDGDGDIDAVDEAIAAAYEGKPPGPSLAAWVAPPEDLDDPDDPSDEPPSDTEAGCGCATSRGGGSTWLLVLLVLAACRRRTACR